MSNSNFIKYLKTFRFWIRFLVLFFVFFNLIFWLKNYSYFFDLYSIDHNFSDALNTVYDVKNTFDYNSFLIVRITTILTAFNIALLIEYIYLQNSLSIKSSIKKENLFISSAAALAILASHCASCGLALFGSLISVSLLSAFPFGGKEFGILAIIILLYTIYNLIKKINNPFVC